MNENWCMLMHKLLNKSKHWLQTCISASGGHHLSSESMQHSQELRVRLRSAVRKGLKNLDAKYIHAPWETPEHVLKSISLELGRDYPKPIVEHGFARNRALEAYGQMKQAA